MPDISVYDSSAVSERVATYILADFSIAIVEWVTPTDYRYTPELTRTVSKYESVSVTESATLSDTIGPQFGMTDGRIPVWEIEGSFAKAFNTLLTLYMPQRSGQGAFGGILDGRRAVHSISASFVTPDVYITVAGRMPTASLESAFGGNLSGKLPTYSLSASFTSEGFFSLRRRSPVWELSAAFTAPSSFILNADIPIWAVSAELDIAWMAISVAGDIPGAFVISASMREEASFSLDESLPGWRLTSQLYSGDFNLSANIPTWLVERQLGAVLQYSSRFTDYVLRYIRP